MTAPEPTPPAPDATGTTLRCPACGPIGPADQKPVDFMTAYVALLKDWRTWVLAFAIVLGIGLVAGALGLGSAAVGAGGGAAISLILIGKVQRIRECARCGALAR